MRRWQFSLRSLLTTTFAVAMWMWAIVTVPAEPSLSGQFFRLLMAIILVGFTRIFRRLFRSVPLSWSGSAVMAGFIVLMSMLFLAIDNRDLSVLQRWQ